MPRPFDPMQTLGIPKRDYASYYDTDDGTNPNSPMARFPVSFRTEGYSAPAITRPLAPTPYEQLIEQTRYDKALDAAKAQRDMLDGQLDVSNPEGQKRLMGYLSRGSINPSQARTMIYAQRSLNPAAKTVKPEKPKLPNESERKAIDSAVNTYQQFTSPGGSEEFAPDKAETFQAQFGRPPSSKEDWQKAYQLHAQALLNAVNQHIENARRWGYDIPDEIIPQQLRGQAPQAAAQPSAQQPISVTAPNGKVYKFQTPEQAAAFKAKAGL